MRPSDAYEKSTQAFVSRLDPQLRFLKGVAPKNAFTKTVIWELPKN
jgi:hypothetical protein